MITPLSEEELKRTATAFRQANGNAAVAAKLIGIPARTMQARKKILEKRPVPDDTVNETSRPLKIFVLPDCQVKPGVNIDHLALMGRYVAEKHPDVVVNLGDFADLHSLSSYDKGKKCFEGRTYKADIDSAKTAMKLFLAPIKNEMARSGWHPRFVLCLGNHENRINRAIEIDRMLEGTISVEDLGYAKDWEVHEFLKPVIIGGVTFVHYVTSGVMGRPVVTASAIISKKHQSVVVGHQQGRQVAYASRTDGSQIIAIIAGSCYTHVEDYLGIQGNLHYRGAVMLHEVENGAFCEMWISIKYLQQKYGKQKNEC